MSTVGIVGAGPAGCAAARALVGHGLDVVVLERGAPGKDKACGDALSMIAVSELARFGLDEDRSRALGGVPFQDFSLQTPHLPEARFAIDGWLVPRHRLDQALREAIAPDVDLRYGADVRAVRKCADQVLRVDLEDQGGPRELACDAVILAHGSAGRLSRGFGLDGAPLPAVAIRVYAAGRELSAEEFHFLPAYPAGYAWAFPSSEQGANVGFFALSAARPESLRHATEAFLRRRGFTSWNRWHGSALALWSGVGRRWHDTAGVVSCGDAAGLVDPLTGEGISTALYSGRFAGEAIAAFLTLGRNPFCLALYSGRVRMAAGWDYGPQPWRTTWWRYGHPDDAHNSEVGHG